MMPLPKPTRIGSFRRPRAPLPAALLLLTASAAAQSADDPESLLRRYPFDPACPWGRISDGKGMVVRCISEGEARTLAGAALMEKGSPAATTETPGRAPEPPGKDAAREAGIEVTVGPVVPDEGGQGDFSNERLAQPKARYVQCVLDHGGMQRPTGEVQVRFLVRPKGVAAGVSVSKRVGVSQEAAHCVAQIVDRRRVGLPDAPLVGATVTVRFDRAAK